MCVSKGRGVLYRKDNEKDEPKVNPAITSEDSPLPSSNVVTDRIEIYTNIAIPDPDAGPPDI